LSKARSKNIDLIIKSPNNLKAKLNPQLIEQAIGNLIDNAVKYSEPNTKINITALIEAHCLLIEVKDEGWGIEKEHIPRLFERFYRVDKSRSRDVGGTGLGLAIVKHIVNAHGGTIKVESKLNHGSTFSIRLPLV
jgi:two-component system phosphate regulon sensor histidine kinase PhoR